MSPKSLLKRLSCCLSAGAVLMAASHAMATGNVVISQVWGGNGTSAGTPNADYVELFNRSAAPVNLNGWSVSVATATGTAWAQLNLPNFTLQPGQYFLIQVTTASATGIALPAVDATFSPQSTSLSSTTGKVALRNVTTAIGTINCPPSDATLVDLVTYGTSGTCFEGAGRAPAGTTTGSGTTATRNAGGCVDSDSNSADFTAVIPNPRNTSTALAPCGALGACCDNNNGACTITAGVGMCANSYQGDNTVCSPNPCPPTGACCNGTTGTTCTLLTATGCANISGGFFQGNGTVCSPSPCTSASCCFANGTCCNLFAALCTSQGGTVGVGTCTAVGNCIAAPSNDLCSSAIGLTLGNPVIGNNFTATSTNDGPSTNCTSSLSGTTKGVWFTFTPPSTSIYEITTCGSTFDTALTVFTVGTCSDSLTWTAVGCDDDACPTGSASFCGTTSSANAALISGILLNSGTTYRIRLQLFGTSATGGGNYTITVNDLGNLAFGACCNNNSAQCEIRTSSGCTGGTPAGTYQGDGTTCSPPPCLSNGACCLSSGICLLRPASGCTGTNLYQGDGSVCDPNPCVTGACCNNTTGACSVTSPSGCSATTSTYQGDNTACSPSPCPAAGTCCNTCTSACSTTVQSACTGLWTLGGSCSPNLCNAGPAPINDEPAGAITVLLGVQVTGEITNATLSVGPAAGCDTSVAKDMWYRFTPPSTGYYSISTCGATFDSVVSIFESANLATVIGCDTDTCVGGATEPVVCGTAASNAAAAVIPFVRLNGGTVHLIRVEHGGTVTTTPGGTFPLTVNAVSAGACCNNTTGVCSVGLATACSASTSTYQGDNSVCSPNPCPPSTDVGITLTTPFSACDIPSGTALQTVYTVTNNGPVAATGVVATFGIPTVFGFQNSTPSGAISLGTLNINIGNLAVNQSVVITINGLTTTGSGSVTASVTRAQLDPTAANNTTGAQGIYVAPTIALPAQLVLSDLTGNPSASLAPTGFFTGSGIDPSSAEVFSRPFASPTGSRFILSVNTDLTATQSRVLVVGTNNPLTLTVVAQEGVTTLDQGDTIGEPDYGLGINENGQYTFSATTSADTLINDVIVRGQGQTHTVVAREGDLAPAAGSGVTYSGANVTAGIRPNGDVAFFATLAGTGGTTTDTALFDINGNTLLAQEGVTIPGGASDPYQAFTSITTGDVGEGFFVNGTSNYSALADLNGSTTNDAVMVVNGTIVLREGDVLPGFTDPVTTILYNNQSPNGDWIAYGSTSGAALDYCVRNGVVLAKTDAPIFAGAAERFDDTSYSQTFFGFVTNGNGDYVISGTTNGAVFSNAVMVVNNQRVIVRENDPVDANGDGLANDGLFIDIFRDDRMFLTNDGWLYFVARLRGPLTGCTAQPASGANEALLRININQGATAVCCRGATCAILSQATCVATGSAGAQFNSGSSTCNSSGNVSTPCCYADYDKTGGIGVPDIFAFLNDWFASSPLADFGGTGSTSPDVADIFDFLNAWFVGGC